jgi:hypothetical protein
MCFGRFPFEATSTEAVDMLILRGQYKMPPSHHSHQTRSLIAAMLCTCPQDRPDIQQVLAALRGTPVSSLPSSQLPLSSQTPPPHQQHQQHGMQGPPLHGRGITTSGSAASAVRSVATKRQTCSDPFRTEAAPRHPVAQAQHPVSAYNPFGPADPFSSPVVPQSVQAQTVSGGSAVRPMAGSKVVSQLGVIVNSQRVSLRGQRIAQAPMSKDQVEASGANVLPPAAECPDSPVLMPESRTCPFTTDEVQTGVATCPDAGNASAPDNPYGTTSATPANTTGAETTAHASAVANATASSIASCRPTSSGAASAGSSGLSALAPSQVDSKLQIQEGTTGEDKVKPHSSGDGHVSDLRAVSDNAMQSRPHARELHNTEMRGNAAPTTLSEALAALQDMTAQRDSLQQRLDAVLQELEMRRVRVVEMRSVIEALSNGNSSVLPARANGVEEVKSKGKGRPFFWDGNKPGSDLPAGQTVADYVREGLQNCDGTVVEPGGLRRFNSDMVFNWEHALNLASTAPVPKAAANV